MTMTVTGACPSPHPRVVPRLLLAASLLVWGSIAFAAAAVAGDYAPHRARVRAAGGEDGGNSLALATTKKKDDDDDVPHVPCPPAVDALGSSARVDVAAMTSGSGGRIAISLPVIEPSDELCALLRRNVIDASDRAYVARSYAGHGWEIRPGPFATSAGDAAGMRAAVRACRDGACTLALPPPGDGYEYALQSFKYGASIEAEASRFLVHATFGPTRDSFADFIETYADAGRTDYASFVRDQMEIEPTLHRAIYRRNVHRRTYEAHEMGRSDGPCDGNSRWRRFAFGEEDVGMELRVDADVRWRGRRVYLLRVDGERHIRERMRGGAVVSFREKKGEEKQVLCSPH